jgi:hypothetical protein
MKTLEECATLEEIHDWLDHGGVTDGDGHPAENINAALQRAAELGRQQGWNEAIEAAARACSNRKKVYQHKMREEEKRSSPMPQTRWDAFSLAGEAVDYVKHEIKALKMPTQKKAEA